jgi:hypothetical protein
MVNTAQGSTKNKQLKWVGLALGIIIVLLGLTAASFAMRPDGTEQLTGAKQDAAKKAISFEEKNSSISPMPSFLRQLHVDEVRAITSDEKAQYCNNAAYISDDPNDAKYYAVVISSQKLFEAKITTTQYACNFLQFDEGYLK